MGGISDDIHSGKVSGYQGLTYRVKWGKDYDNAVERILVDRVDSEFIRYLSDFAYVHTVAAKQFDDIYGILDSTLGIDLAKKNGIMSTYVKPKMEFEKDFYPSVFYNATM